jgi:hypothetical protein
MDWPLSVRQSESLTQVTRFGCAVSEDGLDGRGFVHESWAPALRPVWLRPIGLAHEASGFGNSVEYTHQPMLLFVCAIWSRWLVVTIEVADRFRRDSNRNGRWW